MSQNLNTNVRPIIKMQKKLPLIRKSSLENKEKN